MMGSQPFVQRFTVHRQRLSTIILLVVVSISLNRSPAPFNHAAINDKIQVQKLNDVDLGPEPQRHSASCDEKTERATTSVAQVFIVASAELILR